MKPSKKHFNRLRDKRMESGMSVQLLAHVAKVSRVTINNIESGKYQPHLSTASMLAKALGTTIEQLFPSATARSTR